MGDGVNSKDNKKKVSKEKIKSPEKVSQSQPQNPEIYQLIERLTIIPGPVTRNFVSAKAFLPTSLRDQLTSTSHQSFLTSRAGELTLCWSRDGEFGSTAWAHPFHS